MPRGLLELGLLAAFLLLLVGQTTCAAEMEADSKPTFLLMPRVGVQLEYGGFLIRGEDYSSTLRYRLLLDLFQYRRHLLYLEIDGETSFGIPQDSLAFNRVLHNVAILGYRYDLGDYYLGLRFHHRCHNPFYDKGGLEKRFGRTATSIDFLGLEFLDKAMLVGRKDRGLVFAPDHPFEFLGNWLFAINLNKVTKRNCTDLEWLFMGRLRFDILRYHCLISYLEAGGEVLGQGKWCFTPRMEAGIRVHGGRMEFTPFLQWGRTQEWLLTEPFGKNTRYVSHSYLLGGGRLEFLLDAETTASRPSGSRLEFIPEIHGLAEYGLYLGSRYHMSPADVELKLDLLRWQSLTLFTSLGLNMNSIKANFRPGKVLYWLEYGPRYTWEKVFLEAFVCHARRLDANYFRGLREGANLAGGRVGTRGMLLGHYNEGISFEGPTSFQWLYKINAQASLAHYFDNRDWPFLWNLAAQARWDVLRWRFVVPYVVGGLEWLAAGRGSQDAFEYYVEPGFRLHGVLDLVLYYRFQHRETIWSSQGPKENQNLIGIRALF